MSELDVVVPAARADDALIHKPKKATIAQAIQLVRVMFTVESGEPGGARTRDHRIKSAMLYQLSYRPGMLMRCASFSR